MADNQIHTPVAKTPRSSNFELLRLVAMFLVLGVHANFLSLDYVNSGDFIDNPFAAFGRTFLQAICLVCVNVFVLISGWFSIRIKWRTVAGFAFTVLFWRLIIGFYAIFSGQTHFCIDWLRSLIPGYKEWFVVAYAMLLLFAPAFNAFIDHSDKRTFGIFLIAFYTIQTSVGYVFPIDQWRDVFNGGYSFMTLAGLYFLARYIRLYCHKMQQISATKWLAIFFGLAAVYTLLYYVGQHTGHGHTTAMLFMPYSSPFVVAESVALFMAFSKLKFQSRIVNSLAGSAFAVYLIHTNSYLFKKYLDAVYDICTAHSSMAAFGLVLVLMICVMVVCLAADYIRRAIWHFIEPKS